MTFFADIKDINELKKAFKRLIMKNHPDRGGDTATCQAINAEYDKVMKALINGESDANYGRNGDKYNFWESKEERTEIEIKVKQAIEAIIALDGLEIEVVGVWVWVSGETKKHKEELKKAGYHWHPKKAKWAFAGKKSSGRGSMSMEEVREKYGSQEVQKRTAKQIAAA